jgi:Probable Zinc-ribbon domain
MRIISRCQRPARNCCYGLALLVPETFSQESPLTLLLCRERRAQCKDCVCSESGQHRSHGAFQPHGDVTVTARHTGTHLVTPATSLVLLSVAFMILLTDKNRLSRTHPHVADEWHPTKNGNLTPNDVSFGSGRSVWWQCKKYVSDPEHTWQTTIQSRTRKSNPAGCPACGHSKVTRGSSLAVVFPEQARLFDSKNNGKSAADVRAHSNKVFHWRCPLGHAWKSSVNHMVRPGAGCPFCKGKRVAATNSLAKTYPSIAKLWSPRNQITPDEVTAGSAKRVWWKCSRGHEYQMAVKRKTGPTPRGCPRCNDKRSRPEYTLYAELRLIFPDIQNRHQLYGHEVDIWLPGLGVAVDYDGYAFHRARELRDKKKIELLRKHGVMLFRVREPGLNRVSETDVMLSRGEVGRAAAIIRVLKAISATVSDVTLGGRIAAYIRQGKLLNEREMLELINNSGVREQSLATRFPELAAEWDLCRNHPLTPDAFRPGSHERVWWQCARHPNAPYQASIHNRVNGSACPRCANKIIDEAVSLASVRPDIMKFWDQQENPDLNPRALAVGSERIAHWKCGQGHAWTAAIAALARVDKVECPICTSLGALYPKLLTQFAADLNPSIDPFRLKPNSGKKVWWRCDIDAQHIWQSSPDNRVRAGSGCPGCYRGARRTRSLAKLGKATPGVKRKG